MQTVAANRKNDINLNWVCDGYGWLRFLCKFRQNPLKTIYTSILAFVRHTASRCLYVRVNMGCALWLLFSRSTSTTFPHGQATFWGVRYRSLYFTLYSKFGQSHFSIEASVAQHTHTKLKELFWLPIGNHSPVINTAHPWSHMWLH